MPKIGLRNIKTAVAVSLCLFLYVILILIDKLIADGAYRISSTWYTPFFAGIAAAYSVYPTKTKSVEQAKTRSIASIIGGIYGIVLILIFQSLTKTTWPDFGKNEVYEYIIPYLLIASSCVVVVYITIVLKKTNATFVAILTFLSVTVMGRSGLPFWIFGINRITSTIIGVMIALGVNNFHLPHARNKKFLFIIGLDGLYPNDYGKVEGFIHYKMNNIINDGANVTLFTTRSPTVLIPMLSDVTLHEPVIVLSGAALYDSKRMKYLYVENMDIDLSRKLMAFFKTRRISPFVNTISHDVLYTYCESIDNIGEQVYAENRSNSAYGCFIYDKAPDTEIVYLIIIEAEDIIDGLASDLKKEEFYNDIQLQKYDSYEITGEVHGYHYLKIYSKRINELRALNYFDYNDKKVGMSAHKYDLPLARNVDISVTNSFSSPEIVEKADIIEESCSVDKLFKKTSKIYTSLKYRKS